MKAYLMTASEYLEQVAPLIKEFRKFLKKNRAFFINVDYYGLHQETWSEYKKAELARLKKSGYSLGLPYVKDHWKERTKTHEDPQDAPKEIKEGYRNYMEKLSEFFDEQDIKGFHDDEGRKNKRSVKRAMEDGRMESALIDGEVTDERFQEVLDSVGLKKPRKFSDLGKKVSQGYNRSAEDAFKQFSKEFQKELEKKIKPHRDEIEEAYKGSIENLVGDYLASDYESADRYAMAKTSGRSAYEKITNTLYKYTTGGRFGDGGTKKVEKYDEFLEKAAKEYSDSFVMNFRERIQDKLKVINEKWGIPKFGIERINFQSGILEGAFKMVYPNKEALDVVAEVIFAGGYNIQVLHNRYLIKIYKDDKKVNLKNIDKAFESSPLKHLETFESFSPGK